MAAIQCATAYMSLRVPDACCCPCVIAELLRDALHSGLREGRPALPAILFGLASLVTAAPGALAKPHLPKLLPWLLQVHILQNTLLSMVQDPCSLDPVLNPLANDQSPLRYCYRRWPHCRRRPCQRPQTSPSAC